MSSNNPQFRAVCTKAMMVKQIARPAIKNQGLTNPYDMVDTCSFLEHLRAYQLSSVLGKYKIF